MSASPQSPHRLFVGGLCKLTTEKRLKEYFSAFGFLDYVNIVCDEYGVSRGFAFISFNEQYVTEEILSKIHILDKKQLDIKKAHDPIDYGRVSNTDRRWGIGDVSIKIWNMNFGTTEDEIRAALNSCGNICSVRMYSEKECNSKVSCIVKFNRISDANRLYNESIFIRGKRLDIKPIVDRKRRYDKVKNYSV